MRMAPGCDLLRVGVAIILMLGMAGGTNRMHRDEGRAPAAPSRLSGDYLGIDYSACGAGPRSARRPTAIVGLRVMLLPRLRQTPPAS